MKVKIFYFASLKEKIGSDTRVEELKKGTTVAILRAQLPVAKDRVEYIRAAVNEEFCGDKQVLFDGDELAWIPPVSGG